MPLQAPHKCYHAEFSRFALKGVGINTGEPPKSGSLSIGMGGVRVPDPKIHAPSLHVLSNKVLLRQMVYA